MVLSIINGFYNKMISFIGISGLLFLIIFISGCSDDSEKVTNKLNFSECLGDSAICPDGQIVYREPNLGCEFSPCVPKKKTTGTIISNITFVNKGNNVTNANNLDIDYSGLPSDIIAIIERAKVVKSYEYLDSITQDIVLVKGQKAVFITSNTNKYIFNKLRFNAVYLDHELGTAFVACIPGSKNRNTFLCSDSQNSFMKRSYSSFSYVDPYSYLYKLKDARLIGDKTCENRICDEIEYFEEGVRYKMTVRKVYSMPHRIQEFDAQGNVVKTITFSGAAFNHLSDSEMVVPSEYKQVFE